MYVMGGVYPSSSLLSSFNFNCARFLILEPEECEGAAKTAVEAMPPEVRLVFSGNHVGDQVRVDHSRSEIQMEDHDVAYYMP